MVESLADDLDVDSFGERQRCPGVSEPVKYQSRQRFAQACSVVLLLLSDELSAETLGMVRTAVWHGEDEVLVDVAAAGQQLLLVLVRLPPAKHVDRRPVEVDDMRSLGLWPGLHDDLVVDRTHLPRDHGGGGMW